MPRITAPLLFFVSLLSACAVEPRGKAGGGDAAIEQWSGAHGGPENAGAHVLRDAAGWDAFWREIGRDPPRALRTPDEMAVVVFLGQRRTGGYRPEIVTHTESDGTLLVSFREHAPSAGKMVTQALTTPWVVAVLPGSDLPVHFRSLGPKRTPGGRR